MGNVSSRPDDGAALYFKDQNRCELPAQAAHDGHAAPLLTCHLASEHFIPHCYESSKAQLCPYCSE